jgi:hypothetical protein
MIGFLSPFSKSIDISYRFNNSDEEYVTNITQYCYSVSDYINQNAPKSSSKIIFSCMFIILFNNKCYFIVLLTK